MRTKLVFLLAVAWLCCLVAPAGADLPAPLSDCRIPDARGHYYVVWKRLATADGAADEGPLTFTIAEQAPDTPAVKAVQAGFDAFSRQPVYGDQPSRSSERQAPTVRPGDIVHASGRFDRPPRVILVSSTGLGFVALDVLPQAIEHEASRRRPVVAVVSLNGQLRHAKTLLDLFASEEISRFWSAEGEAFWFRGGWINEHEQDLLILGANNELRMLNLVSGEVRGGSQWDVVRGLDSESPEAVKQALIISADRRLPKARQPALRILDDRRARPDLRLRAAVVLAAIGDRSGAELIRKTAVNPSKELTVQSWDQPFQRAVAIRYLPEAVGQEAVPILVDALSIGGLEATAASGALAKLPEESVPVLAKAVASERDIRLRSAAIGILGSMGPAAREAAGELATALKDDDLLIRIKAALALARVDPTQQGVLPVLRAALRVEVGKPWCLPAREAATQSLLRLGPDGLAILAEALKSQDVTIRKPIVVFLSRLGPKAAAASSALVEALRDQDREVRDWALNALTSIGVQACPALRTGLHHPDRRVRSGCAFVLGRIGWVARSDRSDGRTHAAPHPSLRSGACHAIPALQSALQDDGPLVRCMAAHSLAQLEATGTDGLTTLIDLLEHPSKQIRARAAFCLGRFGPRAEAAVERLKDRLGDSDTVAAAAASSLGRIGPAAASAIPELIAATGQGDRLLRRAAVESLGRFGPEAEAAVPALIGRLKDDDWHVPHLAASALGRIGSQSPEVVSALAVAVESGQGDPDLRIAAIEALARLRPAANRALPVLIDALGDPSPPVARQAVDSVAAFGSDAAPGLADALKHRSKEVRLNAAEALGRIGPDAAAAVPALIAALADGDATSGFYAEEPLRRMGVPAVGPLTAALRDRRIQVRFSAARILGQLGPAAKQHERAALRAAVGALTGALADSDRYVRAHAAYSLGKIGPGARSGTTRRVVAAALKSATRDEFVGVRRAALWAMARLRQ